MKLEISHVSKKYKNTVALQDVCMELEPGVYGLLGPNGAGKSTLLNIITDNLREDEGHVLYDGEDIHKNSKKYLEHLGYMPQQQGLYDDFTAREFLEYMAALKGMKGKEAGKRIEELIEMTNLSEHAHKKLGAFSGGMKQRILIAQALLAEPTVLILDEPTAGLDPRERIRIRNLISRVAKEKIVVIATHVVTDVEYIAQKIILLKGGKVLEVKEISQILEPLEGKVYEILVQEEELEEVKEKYQISNILREKNGLCVRMITEETMAEYNAMKVKPTLDDLYLYVFEK